MNAREIAKVFQEQMLEIKIRQEEVKRSTKEAFEKLGWEYFDGEYTPAYESYVEGVSPRWISPELKEAISSFYPPESEREKFYSIETFAWQAWEETLTEEEKEAWENHWIEL